MSHVALAVLRNTYLPEYMNMVETVTIKDVQTILTQPAGSKLVIVKIITSDDGLYGLGCATFTQRFMAVKTAIEEHLKPFFLKKNALCNR